MRWSEHTARVGGIRNKKNSLEISKGRDELRDA
jgi:hypothetical protein